MWRTASGGTLRPELQARSGMGWWLRWERLELLEDFVHYMSTIEAAWGDVHFVISDMFLTFFR